MNTPSRHSDSQFSGLLYSGLILGLVILALALGGRLLYIYLGDVARFPINHVKVSASYEHISHKEVETAIAGLLDYSFFLLPANQLQTNLKALQWVDQVSIERIWPDEVKITIVEKKPVAQWGNDLMIEDGSLIILGQNDQEMNLPLLYGPDNQQLDVLHVFKKLSKILSGYGLHASGLQLRENQAWELVLANGTLLRLGKKDIESKLERFCRAYPAIFAEKAAQLASVDLRYPRGMAVLWKQETGK